jgi:hypothetical protein
MEISVALTMLSDKEQKILPCRRGQYSWLKGQKTSI